MTKIKPTDKDLRSKLFNGFEGCSNHGCVVHGRRGGVGTNGTCHCLSNASRVRLNILQSRLQIMLSDN